MPWKNSNSFCSFQETHIYTHTNSCSHPHSVFSDFPNFSSSPGGKSALQNCPPSHPAKRKTTMVDAGFVRFPLPLDPSAQEFRPSFPYTRTDVSPFPIHPVYYSYPPSLPPPPTLAPVEAYIIPGPQTILPPPSTVPTRVLLLSSVPADASESTVRRELEVFGDVRAVQMERLRDGIVTVHFYDLRQATEALNKIQEQHMQQQCRLRKHFEGLMFLAPTNPPPLPPPARGLISGRAIWAQFTFPVTAGLPDGYNQGTVVILNLDSDVSSAILRPIFEAFGRVKEIRDTPLKKNQKSVEFYDVRDAAKAVATVNGQDIAGKQVVVEFSRAGGHKYHHKQNKVNPIYANGVPPPPILPCSSTPTQQPPYRKDRLADIDSPRGGYKKNGKYFNKHEQPPEQQGRCVGGGGGGVIGCRNKPWKGSRYTREKCDTMFLIKEDAIVSSFRDSRTTVMIKNIPNKYSQKLVLNMLDNHCIHCNEQVEAEGGDQPLSAYDFVYLPIDFANKCNVGYGFVNMTSPEATWRLYKSFHHQNWEVFNSKKICEVSYARLQGLEALKQHFKNSKFPREAEEYMPVVLTPPRDGRTLTEPIPITTVTSSSASSLSSEVGGHDHSDLTDGTCSSESNLIVEDIKSERIDTIISIAGSSSKGGDGDGDV
ncbi:protein terminal ear1 homolog [Lactuca sativa]|uniref:RRM domain-containing protein n=1 Tax=Lactuca sativa TaxID=4236 RepID=A0A9R1VS17_LACSA|nr:protein terminal ear1 homolog [Lactuca sativa]KAJ0209835.1 hypothetical protein LSAT_V11C400158630 [Lactuca sativa]